jgi:BolA protein
MNREKTIDIMKRKLTDSFAPQFLEIIDESVKHAGHGGARPDGETHFRVKIISDAFAPMNKVAQHRAIYAALADEMEGREKGGGGIHALALETGSAI